MIVYKAKIVPVFQIKANKFYGYFTLKNNYLHGQVIHDKLLYTQV